MTIFKRVATKVHENSGSLAKGLVVAVSTVGFLRGVTQATPPSSPDKPDNNPNRDASNRPS